MASIFNSLNIGYSGLVASQIGVETTSHNITNAESDGYSRQRVVSAASIPISASAGNVGNGVQITDIARVFDSFVFDRYTQISSDKEASDFTRATLEELSTYFPEIDEVGIKTDLKEYYNMWQTFSDNPDNDAIKTALAKQTQLLSQNIKTTQDRVLSLQSSINEQLPVAVDEVNGLAKELASLNVSIENAEVADGYTANDLRDRRSFVEQKLAKLIGAETNVGQIESNIGISRNSSEGSGSYTLSVDGFNIVDGGTYHPIHISNDKSANEFYKLSYERQDGVLIPMNETISGGKIGAILNLRGDKMTDTTSGIPENGILQNVVNQLDAFASKIIESTNNLYATTTTTRMESNTLKDLEYDDAILDSSLNVKAGAFDVVIYDIDGKEAGRRTINIDYSTTMSGAAGSNSIEGQLSLQKDDNGDANATNDVDDFINYHWATYNDGSNGVEFSMDSMQLSRGYTFAIQDKLTTESFNSGSNFAGALGLNRFFDGNSARNIDLNFELKQNPTEIRGGKTSNAGDNFFAIDMVQQQFETYDFQVGDSTVNSTIYGMFDVVATEVGISANDAIMNNDGITAKYNATELEFSSITKVNIDEELTNLIKYQTAYGAASKIITTIDQMMQTLLGLKQ